MDLHRIEGKPEWADVKPADMNAWQRVAQRSGGLVTIGNYFSLLGLLSVPFGLSLILNKRYVAGIIVLLLGRFCDILDGYVADKTGTKSPLGEKIDAVFDKISTALAVFVLALSGLVPWWAVASLLLPHIVVAGMALSVFVYGLVLHPSRYGKLSMAAGWLCLLAFVAINAFDGVLQTLVTFGAYGLLAVSVVVGFMAMFDYRREYLQLTSRSK